MKEIEKDPKKIVNLLLWQIYNPQIPWGHQPISAKVTAGLVDKFRKKVETEIRFTHRVYAVLLLVSGVTGFLLGRYL